jgi:membrane protease YdiL (CAAX protease family)
MPATRGRVTLRAFETTQGRGMRKVFLDAQGKLRNGWWMGVFVAFFVATTLAYTPISRTLQSLGVHKDWLQPLPFLFALFATWACTRLRREPLASVGFRLGRRWALEWLAGLGLGCAAIGAVVALIALAGGVRLELSGDRTVGALAFGFYLMLFVSLLEETLFRGFLFQRLRDGAGLPVAIFVFAVLFALMHEGNPGMSASTRVVAMLDIALASVLLALAYVRTGSLALPVGLHLGWNWMQGSVLGFNVSGMGLPGWWQPVPQAVPDWLGGGAFGPEASIFSVVVDLVLIAALWRWRGTVAKPAEPTSLPGTASAPA